MLVKAARFFCLFVLLCPGLFLVPTAQAAGSPTASAACPRYAAGAAMVAPPDLFSKSGILQLNLTYKTRVDAYGNTLYCFTTDDGLQSPTLHVHPGDELVIR